MASDVPALRMQLGWLWSQFQNLSQETTVLGMMGSGIGRGPDSTSCFFAREARGGAGVMTRLGRSEAEPHRPRLRRALLDGGGRAEPPNRSMFLEPALHEAGAVLPAGAE